MTGDKLYQRSVIHLETLCRDITGRSVGSDGNRQATRFFEKELSLLGWETTVSEFDAIDWQDDGATLKYNEEYYSVLASPYSLDFKGEAELVSASNLSELEILTTKDKIILLYGEIAREQLMPKNFVFYNPEEHQKIIATLEKSEARAIICATGRNSALAGGVYPFPLIEDGDFNIPSVYMTEEEGEKLFPLVGKNIFLESRSKRIPAKGYNVKGLKGNRNSLRIVVSAHIDSKIGTPGAIDNATGVIILILLADLLRDYEGDNLIEFVAFNGEDYYAVPGQMIYIAENRDNFNNILLNINIDGAGYKEGPSAFSLFDLPEKMDKIAQEVIREHPGITEGVRWPQGDHSIFLQYGIPAIAVSSMWFTENINGQDITHTPKDNIEIVDCNKLVEISRAINTFIRKI